MLFFFLWVTFWQTVFQEFVHCICIVKFTGIKLFMTSLTLLMCRRSDGMPFIPHISHLCSLSCCVNKATNVFKEPKPDFC